MKKRRVPGAPTYVQILLTRQCGLSCFYCSADQFNQKEKEPELTTREWIRLLHRLRDIQVFQVDFSGGELFTRTDIFEILEAAVECRFPRMAMVTNGTLIDGRVAERLQQLGFKNIAVSLDGDEGAHDRIRGAGTFQKTLRGIHNLVSGGIIPTIQFTLLRSNYKSLDDLVAQLHPLGIKKLDFNILHPTGRCAEIYKEIMPDHLAHGEELQGIIDRIREKYRDFGIAGNPLIYRHFSKNYIAREKGDKREAGVSTPSLKACSAGHTSCNITAGGWVIPCSELFDFKGGNIREQDITDIWQNSKNLDKIRRLSEVPASTIPYCRNCDFNIFCNAGCRADAYAVYRDLRAPDPFCPYWKEQ